jgi:hypothetical protein
MSVGSAASRAVGAVGARLPDTEKVTGSNPVRPTRGLARYALANSYFRSMWPSAVLHDKHSSPRTHLPHDFFSSGQQAWSWSMKMGCPSPNAVWHIAQAWPCSPSSRSNSSCVRPYRDSLYFREYLRLAAAGSRLIPRRRSVRRIRSSAMAAAVRQSPICPRRRAQMVLLRGIHLPHSSSLMRSSIIRKDTCHWKNSPVPAR